MVYVSGSTVMCGDNYGEAPAPAVALLADDEAVV